MRRLDPERPVAEADLRKVLTAATKGPTGGNRQPIRWLVIRDPELKRRVGEVYREAARAAIDAGGDTQSPHARSSYHLADHLGEAPVLVIPCADFKTSPASVYPSVQNLMLAARALGLGSTLTTIHRVKEDEVKAILGIPADVQTFAIIPIGYPLGRWAEAPRKPIDEVVYWDRWP
jgi:nitroreductase